MANQEAPDVPSPAGVAFAFRRNTALPRPEHRFGQPDWEVRMRALPIAAIFALLSAGCRPVHDTEATHITHAGETAVLENHAEAWVYVALDKEPVHNLARAVETKDQQAIDEMIRARQALRVPAHTAVRVLRESFNERLVKIEEGASAGTSVWVPYEWLKARPVQAPRGGA